MKSRLLLIAVFLMGMGACTQKMCPTYAKKDIKTETKAEDSRV